MSYRRSSSFACSYPYAFLKGGNEDLPVAHLSFSIGSCCLNNGVYRNIDKGIINGNIDPHLGDKIGYDNISPVNSFRLIFNHYFGANYDLLEDD